jgi:RNA polymerase sigma-70 factor (ECF subfamily)
LKGKTPSLEKLNSPQFIMRLHAGEETAFRELNADLFVKLTDFARQEFGINSEDAKDLTQQTVIAIFQKIRLFDPQKGNFLSWVFRIQRNHCIDWLRKLKRMPSSMEIAVENLVQEDSACVKTQESVTLSGVEGC